MSQALGQSLVFKNARMVLPDAVQAGSLSVQAGCIAGFDAGNSALPQAIDLEGDFLMPGFIEVHTDNFERHLMPRPKVRWSTLPALLAHDAEVAASGITTVFDSLGVGDTDEEALRGQGWGEVIEAIDRAAQDGLLRAEHLLHVRCELAAPNTVDLFEPFVGDARVGLISLMDHTPGQRQWENIEQARVYYTGKKGWSDEKFDRQVAGAKAVQEQYALPHRRHFVEYAKRHGIVLASHDDTRPEHVLEAHSEGATISEFPTSVLAARMACEKGMSVVMGAPNVVRGGSHSGNVSALDLARQGLLHTLSSDYVPISMLMAAFRLVDEAGWSIPQAVASVSRNPAASLGLEDRGEIAPGMRADLVQVRLVEGLGGRRHPVVRAVWREGRRVV
jgi:alpha-D-ribose 1-methylphosphonate 5-triphosphate diphosphatase